MFDGSKRHLSNPCNDIVYALWTSQESTLPGTMAEERYECSLSPSPAIVKYYFLQSPRASVTLRLTLYCQAPPEAV